VSAHPGFGQVLDQLATLLDDPSVGVAAPSANRFGRVSPTTAQHVVDELTEALGPHDVILEGGPSRVGVESTIVDCTGPAPVILRPGHVSAEQVEQVTGTATGEHSTVRAPGTLASHYAPRAAVSLISAEALNDLQPQDARTGLLALASIATPPGFVRLSAPENADDYARDLYSALREADALELSRVVAIPPSPAGIGAAVIDRLERAATR